MNSIEIVGRLESYISVIIIHKIFSLARDWSKHVTWPAKIGEYPKIFPNFQNRACCEKYLKDNKDNSLHLAWKYARIFVLGHYLFLDVHSFPRATLSESCSLLGTDNVCGQISVHIFAKWRLLFIYCKSTVKVAIQFSGIMSVTGIQTNRKNFS